MRTRTAILIPAILLPLVFFLSHWFYGHYVTIPPPIEKVERKLVAADFLADMEKGSLILNGDGQGGMAGSITFGEGPGGIKLNGNDFIFVAGSDGSPSK